MSKVPGSPHVDAIDCELSSWFQDANPGSPGCATVKNRQTFSPVSALSASMKQLSLPLPQVPPEITFPSTTIAPEVFCVSVLNVSQRTFPVRASSATTYPSAAVK